MSVDFLTTSTSSDVLQSPAAWSKILFSDAIREKALLALAWAIGLWLLLVTWATNIYPVVTGTTALDLLLPVLLIQLAGILVLIPLLFVGTNRLSIWLLKQFQTQTVYIILLAE